MKKSEETIKYNSILLEVVIDGQKHGQRVVAPTGESFGPPEDGWAAWIEQMGGYMVSEMAHHVAAENGAS